MNEQPLLEFPAEFPVKVMGRNDVGFEALVIELIKLHAPDLDVACVTTRESSGGKYLAVTVNVTATSREQLDAIYLELTSHGDVVMAL